jgi:DNA-binding CsgD family transcriptional regulator
MALRSLAGHSHCSDFPPVQGHGVIVNVFGLDRVSPAVEAQVGLVMLARTHPDLRPRHMRGWRMPTTAKPKPTMDPDQRRRATEASNRARAEKKARRMEATIQMRRDGFDAHDIAAALGITPNMVWKYGREARKRGLLE